MATETVQASGTTTPNNWTLEAGASKQVAVNAPDDDATSYIQSTGTVNTEQWFTCTPSAISVGDTVTQVAMNVRYKRGLSSDADFVIGYIFTIDGGGYQSGTSGTLTGTSSYQSSTYTHSSLSAVWGSALQIWAKNTQARRVDISTLEIVLTYTPAAGGQPMVARARAVPGMRRPHGGQGW